MCDTWCNRAIYVLGSVSEASQSDIILRRAVRTRTMEIAGCPEEVAPLERDLCWQNSTTLNHRTGDGKKVPAKQFRQTPMLHPSSSNLEDNFVHDVKENSPDHGAFDSWYHSYLTTKDVE